MASSFKVENNVVKANIEALQKFMNKENLDGFYISSFDEFLNEYVPMENCHRFYLTGFSGSVASVLVPPTGKVKLYVDGRYHEQADNEVDASVIEVVKLDGDRGLYNSVWEDVEEAKMQSVGIEGERTSLDFYQNLEKVTSIKSFNNGELSSFIDFVKMPDLSEIIFETKVNRGKDTKEKLDRIFKDDSSNTNKTDEAYFVTAIDSLAWVTNCRGYHLPNLSSFLGRGFVTHDKVYVFLDTNTPISKEAQNIEGVEFFQVSTSEIQSRLTDISNSYSLSKVFFDPKMLNSADYQTLTNIFDDKTLVAKKGGLVGFHAIKDEEEIEIITRCFEKGDQAIYDTLKWAKKNVSEGAEISELDLYHQTTIQYQKQGAKEQSFNTIAGVGANGSIIHYGDPKSDVIMKKNDMVLLDSGGYFDGGFATDTTRTFVAGDEAPHADCVKIYTATLKGVLQCQNAIFPKGATGITLDAYARKPIFDIGMNFAHGTGHGVGIHVHEDGARISPVADIKMKAGQVVSIEPGIYISGFGGVRIENIVFVEEHPEFDGFLRFRPLVYIGYEPKLIDMDKLTKQEKVWLEDYEKECEKRGRSFRS